jgi:hypothetical protein
MSVRDKLHRVMEAGMQPKVTEHEDRFGRLPLRTQP